MIFCVMMIYWMLIIVIKWIIICILKNWLCHLHCAYTLGMHNEVKWCHMKNCATQWNTLCHNLMCITIWYESWFMIHNELSSDTNYFMIWITRRRLQIFFIWKKFNNFKKKTDKNITRNHNKKRNIFNILWNVENIICHKKW